MTMTTGKLRIVGAVLVAAAALAACSGVPVKLGTGRNTTGSYLAGHLAAAEGDLKSAAGFYSHTLRDDPANNDLLTRTFLYTAAMGDTDRAISLAQRIAEQDTDNRAARLVLSLASFKKKNYTQALVEVRKSATGPFTSITNSLLQAWALEGLGDTDGALKELKGLETQSGAQGLFAFHQALILDHAGRTSEAQTAYQSAIGLLGAGPRVADAYGRFLEMQGQAGAAKDLYTRLEKDNPGHPVAKMALQRIEIGKKPTRLIATPADGAAEGLFGVAASLTEERSADVAIFYLNLTLYLRPDLELARVLLADHYENQEKYDVANAIYAKISSSSPYRAMVEVQIAINEARLGNTAKAIASLKAQAKARPQDPDAWTALGDIERSAQNFTEAAAAYAKAIEITGPVDARRWGLLYARGVSLERAKKWDEAERDLQEALRLKPDQPQVLNYLGYSWVDRGHNLKEAVGMLEKARALRPLDGYIVDSVGWAYFRLGRYADAATTLEQAVLLAPADPTINDHLGDAYWRVGRKLEASFQWRHALALNPEADQKPIIERKLEVGLDAATGGPS